MSKKRIILSSQDKIKAVNSLIFPGIQGGPLMHVIAAAAVTVVTGSATVAVDAVAGLSFVPAAVAAVGLKSVAAAAAVALVFVFVVVVEDVVGPMLETAAASYSAVDAEPS